MTRATAAAPKERMKIARQQMPEQPAGERRANFVEVNLGLTVRSARPPRPCAAWNAPSPHCMHGCPVDVNIREFVRPRHRRRLPGGRGQDPRGQRPAGHHRPRLPAGDPVRGLLHPRQASSSRSASATWSASSPTTSASTGALGLPRNAPADRQEVAIVGSGPAGLAAAGDLVQLRPRRHGLRGAARDRRRAVYGIPEFRLPKDIVRQEVESLRQMGVEFETNVVIGRTVTVDELLGEEGYRRRLRRHRRGAAAGSWACRASTSTASTRPTSS